MPKSKAEMMKKRREALTAAGLVKAEVWHKPENKAAVMALDERNTITKAGVQNDESNDAEQN